MGEHKEKSPETQWADVDIKKNFRLGVRHVQMFCMWVCMIALFVVRGSMGIAVLAMTDHNRLNDTNVMIYDWDKKTQGVVLSSFFWGYMAMQIPAGVLAKRFGGKPILLVALLANGMLCLVLPTLAQLGGWRLVCALRVAMGLTQACLFPASHTLLGRWLPTHERTSLTGIVYAGSQIGTIIAMPVSGLLAETAMGWKLIFYSMAALMLATAALWYGLAASSPAQHRLISPAERAYIEKGLNTNTSSKQVSAHTPWRQILRSVPVWAVVASHFGCCAGFILFFVDMPTYIERGLGISLRNSALLSALPYLGMWFGCVMSSVLCEKIFNKGLLSLINCRKLFNSICLFGVAAGLVVLSFLGPEQQLLAIVTLVITLTLDGFCAAGFMVNHLDLSPNYAGVLLSLTNFLSNTTSIMIPILTGIVLKNDSTDVSRWRIVFLGVAAISAVSNTVYLWLGSADQQPWDDPAYRPHAPADPEEMKPVLNQEKKQITLIKWKGRRQTSHEHKAAPIERKI